MTDIMKNLNDLDLRKIKKARIELFDYGGIKGETYLCLMRDLQQINNDINYQFDFTKPAQDAGIGRSRCWSIERFLSETDADVLVWIDHDIIWRSGDLVRLVNKCIETQSIVGGFVAKKTFGQGFAHMLKDDDGVILDKDVLHPAWFLGGAFTAYPRRVLQALVDYPLTKYVVPGFHDVAIDGIGTHPKFPKKLLHLTEDWIISHKAREWLSVESYGYAGVLCLHKGEHIYTPFDAHFDYYKFAMEQIELATKTGKPICPDGIVIDTDKQKQLGPKPRIACLHATRNRPREAERAFCDWAEKASGEIDIEYIYSFDTDDENLLAPENHFDHVDLKSVTGDNRGCVDAYNAAAYAASPECTIFVQVHDDVVPPQDWDKAIVNAFAGHMDKPAVLRVSDGNPKLNETNQLNKKLNFNLICNKAFLLKTGYFYYPEYVSVFCDNDISEKAEMENLYIESDLVFRHNWKSNGDDSTYQKSYSKYNWGLGEKILSARRSAGFPDAPHLFRGKR